MQTAHTGILLTFWRGCITTGMDSYKGREGREPGVLKGRMETGRPTAHTGILLTS